VAVALFAVLIGVSGSVYFRFVVRFCMVCGAHGCCYGCASTMFDGCVCKEISEEEGGFSL